MKKTSIIITLGIFIVVIPFLGFPQSWETTFFVLAGLSISILSFSLKSKNMKSSHCENKNNNSHYKLEDISDDNLTTEQKVEKSFVESKPKNEVTDSIIIDSGKLEETEEVEKIVDNKENQLSEEKLIK